MRLLQHRITLVALLALALPFGCGKDSDNGSATGGSGGASAGAGGSQSAAGTNNRAGSGGRMSGTSGTGPTGCEGLTPMTGDSCDDEGIVCPNQRGSCVCDRAGGQRRWECFEVGGGDGGADGVGGAGNAGEAGVGGENSAGAGGAPGTAGGPGEAGGPAGGAGGEAGAG